MEAVSTNLALIRVPSARGKKLVDDADAVYELVSDSPPDARLELGDGWLALHVLLTAEMPMPRHAALERGVEWDDASLENALMGGEATPYEDAFTVARFLTPAQVKLAAKALAKVKVPSLPDRFDDEVEEMLPASWRDVDAAAARLTASAQTLISWYQRAADAGEGMLLYAE